MEIVEKKQVFNNGFITYLKKDYRDYLNKLLTYTSKQEKGIEYSISERIQEFGSGLLEYLISHETNEDYEEDIDETRKEKLEVMLYDIDNYLMSLEPFEAFQKFMNSNISSLITESQIYSNNLRKKIIDNIFTIQSVIPYESKENIALKNALDTLALHTEERFRDTFLYSTMNTDLIGIDGKTPLISFLNYSEDLLTEASIISKFNEKGREYITGVLNKAQTNPASDRTGKFVANLCDSILFNYVMLSLYSNTPEKLKITNKMLETILFEVQSGTIGKDDIISAIVDGPIKFTESDIDYINKYFVDKLFNENKNSISNGDIIKLVK